MAKVTIILEDTSEGVSRAILSSRALPIELKDCSQAELMAIEINGLLEKTFGLSKEILEDNIIPSKYE